MVGQWIQMVGQGVQKDSQRESQEDKKGAQNTWCTDPWMASWGVGFLPGDPLEWIYGSMAKTPS